MAKQKYKPMRKAIRKSAKSKSKGKRRPMPRKCKTC